MAERLREPLGWCWAEEVSPRVGREEERRSVKKHRMCKGRRRRREWEWRGQCAVDGGSRPEGRCRSCRALNMPKYGISADKSILPVGYPYSMGNYPRVWVIWLPIPVRVQVRFFPPQYPGVLPTFTHGLPMSTLKHKPGDCIACVQLCRDASFTGHGERRAECVFDNRRLAGVHTDGVWILGSLPYYIRRVRLRNLVGS